MWSTLKRLSLGVILIFLASAVLLLSDLNRRASGGKGVPRISLLQHASVVVLDEGTRGMVNGLAAKGFVEGKTIIIEKYNSEGDIAVANSIAKQMVNSQYDLLLTCSTISLQAVANANRGKKTIQVFGLSADPPGAGVGISREDPLQHPPQKSASEHAAQGYTLLEKKDWSGALVESREAVRLEPNNSEFHVGIGTALQLGKKDWDGAIQEFREANRLDPKSDTAHQYLGEALGAKGDDSGEFREENEALRLNPENRQARSDLNEAPRGQGNAQESRNENQDFNAVFFGIIGFIALLGFAGGLFCFVKGFLIYRKFRVFEDTPEVPIRSIAMGLSHFHGKALGEQSVPAPVSKQSCYFYVLNIERWEKDSKGRGGAWMDYATLADGVKFYLKDTTGKIQVDAHGAEYDLRKTGEQETLTPWKSTAWREADQEWAPILERAKPGTWPGLYRLHERTIVPHGSYDVIGTCVENNQVQDEHDRKLIMKERNEATFLISCWSEKTVKEDLRQQATRYVFGGAGLAIACLAFFLITTHWSHWI